MKYELTDFLYFLFRAFQILFLIYYFGFINGLILAYLKKNLISLVLNHVFGLEPLSAVDELFIFDNERNVCNIVSKRKYFI